MLRYHLCPKWNLQDPRVCTIQTDNCTHFGFEEANTFLYSCLEQGKERRRDDHRTALPFKVLKKKNESDFPSYSSCPKSKLLIPLLKETLLYITVMCANNIVV